MLSLLFSLSVGERLWVTTPVAFFLSALLVLAILRVGARLQERAPNELAITAVRLFLSGLLTAVMYFEALFVSGYLGYFGPLNVIWLVGFPATAAILAFGGKMRRAVIFFPLVLIESFIATWMLAAMTGLPLD